jgi:hypothetical protein
MIHISSDEYNKTAAFKSQGNWKRARNFNFDTLRLLHLYDGEGSPLERGVSQKALHRVMNSSIPLWRGVAAKQPGCVCSGKGGETSHSSIFLDNFLFFFKRACN